MTPKTGYKIAVIDPPWLYFNRKNNDPSMGGFTYPPMSQESLKELHISQIMADDSLIFVWGTLPKLPECLEFIASQGYTYTTTPFVWIKLNPKGSVEIVDKSVFLYKGIYSGLGHYTAGNAEVCLLGKRGKGVPRITKSVKQVILAPRGRHSQKPDEAQIRIKTLFGDEQPCIELFATRELEGWTCIGNEITGTDIREDLTNIIKEMEK